MRRRSNIALGLVFVWCAAAGASPVSTAHAGRSHDGRRVPTPLEFVVLDTETTLWHNDVYSIGSQRQYGTYEVPIGITNDDAGDVGLVDVNITLSGDDWVLEQDPTGQMLEPGQMASMRIRLVTDTVSSGPLVCPIIVTSSAGSTSFEPFVFTLVADSVDAETEVPGVPSLVPAAGPVVPNWPASTPVTVRKPAANFTRAPHALIGWDLDTNAAATAPFYLGVHAAMDGGIHRVEFYLEGDTATVTQELISPESINQGVPGYYVKIDPTEYSGTGVRRIEVYARVYSNAGQVAASSGAKATPRIIGPWVGWVFPSGVEPYVIDVLPSTQDFAHKDDASCTLWRVLTELMAVNSQVWPTGYPAGCAAAAAPGIPYPPDKPVVLQLGPGFHVLPSADGTQAQYSVYNNSTGTYDLFPTLTGGVGPFNDWTCPLAITTAPTVNPAQVILTASRIKGIMGSTTSPAQPGKVEICAPVVIYNNLVIDHSRIDTIEVETGEAGSTDGVFLGCEFFDSNGRNALYYIEGDQSSPDGPMRKIATSSDHPGVVPGDMVMRGASFGAFFLEDCHIHDTTRALVNPSLVRNCLIEDVSRSLSNNAEAMFKVVGRRLDPSALRADMRIGSLVRNDGTNSIVKVGSPDSKYALNNPNPLQATYIASGAILLFADDNPANNIPTHVIALGLPASTQPDLPGNWLPPPAWYPVESANDLRAALQAIAGPVTGTDTWDFQAEPAACEIPRSAIYVNKTTGGFAAFPTQPTNTPAGQYPERLNQTDLSLAVDVHTQIFQWFAGSGQAVDNRTYWSIDYDQETEPHTLGCPATLDRGPQYAGAFQIQQGSSQGVFNSSIRCVRLTMRPSLSPSDISRQPAFLQSKMANVLLTNLTLEGAALQVKGYNDPNSVGSWFVPSWVTVRDSYLDAMPVQQLTGSALVDCDGIINGTTPSPYASLAFYVSNCHYSCACDKDPSNAANQPMYVRAHSQVQPCQSVSGVWGTIHTLSTPLNDDGRCSWGEDALLDTLGRPHATQSPLLFRADPPRTKYDLHGILIPDCGAIGAIQP